MKRFFKSTSETDVFNSTVDAFNSTDYTSTTYALYGADAQSFLSVRLSKSVLEKKGILNQDMNGDYFVTEQDLQKIFCSGGFDFSNTFPTVYSSFEEIERDSAFHELDERITCDVVLRFEKPTSLLKDILEFVESPVELLRGVKEILPYPKGSAIRFYQNTFLVFFISLKRNVKENLKQSIMDTENSNSELTSLLDAMLKKEFTLHWKAILQSGSLRICTSNKAAAMQYCKSCKEGGSEKIKPGDGQVVMVAEAGFSQNETLNYLKEKQFEKFASIKVYPYPHISKTFFYDFVIPMKEIDSSVSLEKKSKRFSLFGKRSSLKGLLSGARKCSSVKKAPTKLPQENKKGKVFYYVSFPVALLLLLGLKLKPFEEFKGVFIYDAKKMLQQVFYGQSSDFKFNRRKKMSIHPVDTKDDAMACSVLDEDEKGEAKPGVCSFIFSLDKMCAEKVWMEDAWYLFDLDAIKQDDNITIYDMPNSANVQLDSEDGELQLNLYARSADYKWRDRIEKIAKRTGRFLKSLPSDDQKKESMELSL